MFVIDNTPNTIADFIKKFFESIFRKKTSDKISSIRQKTGLITENLPVLSKEKVNEFIVEAVQKCPSINEADFENLVKILSTLEKTKNKYSILYQLALLSSEDWGNLEKIMREWTIAVAKDVLDEIQHRLNLINELKRLTSKDDTYEVQELQPMIEKCLWMFGPEYESIEYTSNQSIATCFQKYLGKKASQPVSKNRPDFTVIPDGAVSFYSTPEYDEIEAHETGIRRLVIIELKALSKLDITTDNFAAFALFLPFSTSVGTVNAATTPIIPSVIKTSAKVNPQSTLLPNLIYISLYL